jgi:4a-hydroxytetrahydrobiopterin dehydratase
MEPLTANQIQQQFAPLKDWQIENGELTRTFQLDSFVTSLNFVNRVGELAERAGHHPDIDIRYNKVRLSLSTHDAGGLTTKDFELAGRIDMLGMAR